MDLYRFFPKGGVDAFLSNGRVTGIPSQLSTHLLWYNKTLLDADGMPYPSRDWRMTEELVVNARKLTRDIDGDGIIDQWGFGSVNMYTMAPLFLGHYDVDRRFAPFQPPQPQGSRGLRMGT